MLVLSRKVGEVIVIGSGDQAIRVVVTSIAGSRISLGIAAPPEVPSRRQPRKSGDKE